MLQLLNVNVFCHCQKVDEEVLDLNDVTGLLNSSRPLVADFFVTGLNVRKKIPVLTFIMIMYVQFT